jgi:hypothetical protein
LSMFDSQCGWIWDTVLVGSKPAFVLILHTLVLNRLSGSVRAATSISILAPGLLRWCCLLLKRQSYDGPLFLSA